MARRIIDWEDGSDRVPQNPDREDGTWDIEEPEDYTDEEDE